PSLPGAPPILGSWIGTSPRRRASTLATSISTATTGWPISAKHVAVTSPTQPAPTTPIGSCAFIAATPGASLLLLLGLRRSDPVHRLRDGEHLILLQRLQQRVVEPVRALVCPPRDEAQPVAVEEQVVLATADLARLARVVKDRGVGPSRAHEPVVLGGHGGTRDRENVLVGRGDLAALVGGLALARR